MKKIIILIMSFIFAFNNVLADTDFDAPYMYIVDNTQDDLVDNDVDELFLPAIAIPSALGYLMAAFGVAATGTIIYQNKEAFESFYEKQVESFKMKCSVLGVGAGIVENWLTDLSSGVVKKSSEVYSAFKTWVSELRHSSVIAGGFPSSTGVLKANHKYNLLDFVPGLSNTYNSLTVEIGDYDCYIYGYKYSKYTYYIVLCLNYLNTPNNYWELSYVRSDGLSSVTRHLDTSDAVYCDGTRYSASSVLSLDSFSYLEYIPYVYNGSSVSSTLPYYLSGDYTLESTISDFTVVGDISNVDDVVIKNPGIVDDTSDVVIDWGNLSPVEVVGGVANGTISWGDALTQGGIVASENDIVIGGDDTVVEDKPVVDFTWWEWLKEWTSNFFNNFNDMLLGLFVPDPDFFKDYFMHLKDMVSKKFGFDNYIEFFESLKGLSSHSPEFGGFINTSIWTPYIDKIHYYIKGFIYALLVIFNVRMIIWTIRGSTPIKDGQGNVTGGRSS